MASEVFQNAVDCLRALKSDDPKVQRLEQALSGPVSTGNIIGSTGVAIGHDIRLVINQFNLPGEVVSALLNARAALGGIDARRYLPASLIEDKTAGFVGRDFVFKAIETFLESHPNGYMVIEGDPGMGKTSLIAEYVRRTGCLVHFNSRGQNIIFPSQFNENVCAQIITEFGLPYPAISSAAVQDSALLSRLLDESSQKLKKGERLVIAVDALDEVDLTSVPRGGNILNLPPILPRSVYFIMTRRGGSIPFAPQAPIVSLDLLAYPADNRRDVEIFLRKSTERPKISAWIRGQPGVTNEKYVSIMADRSANNFMYLRYVLREIEDGLYQDLKINFLPQNLLGYYQSHWDLMGMSRPPLPRLKILIIYILCETVLPISCDLTCQILKNCGVQTDEWAVQEVLDEWGQFLHKEPGPGGKCYAIYHNTFREFLSQQETVKKAGVTLKDINAMIAEGIAAPISKNLDDW